MAIPGDLVEDFEAAVGELQTSVYTNAIAHGFWDGDGTSPGEKICLMHQELSELFDNYRDGDNTPSSKIPPFTNAEEEAADLVIRLMDFCEHFGLRLGPAILAKHEYNIERPYKHGRGKF